MVIVPVEKRIDWKRPPIVLIFLVLVNVLVFAFYQGNDTLLLEEAVEIYTDEGLLKVELPAYRAYVGQTNPDFKVDPRDPSLVFYIVSDPGFDEYLESNYHSHISPDQRIDWQSARTRVTEVRNKLSYLSLGLVPTDVSVVTLFTHQFLHGDILHLLGNLVFLVLTGFAVEAALGHLSFLVYYLVAGLGSALLFTLVNSLTGGSSTSLVGASGAISGVMAMYVVLFQSRKIEFFYWFFIFTGYFRAVAIIMLPAYVLKELFMLYANEGSNVAYTAHIGGFIAGAALVLATKSMQKNTIDDAYLDGREQAVDPYREYLHKLCQEIGRGEFQTAWKRLGELKKTYKGKPELIDIEYNLINALDFKKANDFLMSRLGRRGNTRRIIEAQLESWRKTKDEDRALLSFSQKSALLSGALNADLAHIAEEIFSLLKTDKTHVADVAVLARKLAMHYQEQGRSEKFHKYNLQAQDLIRNSQAVGNGDFA